MKRNWRRIHSVEEKEKQAFLKKLTPYEGFRIFSDLYELAHRTVPQREIALFHQKKIETLVKIRGLFKNVDAADSRES